jgi:hypothetical protein
MTGPEPKTPGRARFAALSVLALAAVKVAGTMAFADVEAASSISNSYGLRNEEFGRPIFVCRHPRRPLWQDWPGLKRLD